MAESWKSRLERWRQAGLIEPATAEAIRTWEKAQRSHQRLRLPVLVAVALGGVLVAAGLLLFVSTHWEALAPAQRFALLLALVVGLHGGAAAVEERFPSLAVALHGVGTVTLGAGLFLAGQLFHLEAHWPLGLLLWAIGAGLGWASCANGPSWPCWPCWGRPGCSAHGSWPSTPPRKDSSEDRAIRRLWPRRRQAWCCSASATWWRQRSRALPHRRRVLLWLGGLGLLPAGLLWQLFTHWAPRTATLPLPLAFCGWTVALGTPLLLGLRLRGRRTWPLAVAIGWLLPGVAMAWGTHQEVGVFTYLWWPSAACCWWPGA